jgi:glycine betaine/proline transport system ATP-binding protein
MTERETKISIENVYKIFGPDPQSVLQRVREGMSKQDVLEETGHTVGIKDVSLEIGAGEIYVIMGLSGSGKSTLIRHINRLIEPTSGRILVDGEDVLTLNQLQLRELRRHKISMVFQRFALLPHKTVLENSIIGRTLRGESKAEAHERAMAQIELVGLEGFENQYPSQLSGGMQQRVGLARALATDAEVLLMDEAFSALDPLIRNDMQDQLIEIQKTLNRTIVFITHDLDEALRIGDKIAILRDGELRQVGTGEDILMNPADDYVSRFVKDVNRGRVVTVGSIAANIPSVGMGQATYNEAIHKMRNDAADATYVVDESGKPIGAVTEAVAAKLNGRADDQISNTDDLAPVNVTSEHTVIEDMLTMIVESDVPVAVTDDSGKLIGGLGRGAVIQALVRANKLGSDG